MRTYIDPNVVEDLLHYSPETGEFAWKKRTVKYFTSVGQMRRWNTSYLGRRVGRILTGPGGCKYLRVTLLAKRYMGHRVAWVAMTGEQPPLVIDHLDGDSLNNKWENMRDGGNARNQKNRSMLSNNTSGVCGVDKTRDSGKWMARVHHEGKRHCLGRFDEIDDAERAVKEFRRMHGYTERHGTSIRT